MKRDLDQEIDLEQLGKSISARLTELTSELEKLRRRGFRTLALVVLIIGAMFAAVGIAVVDSRHHDRENDRRWCALLDATTRPVPSNAPATPTTARQRAIIAQLNQLRRDLGCV